jgi:hypothetical protein
MAHLLLIDDDTQGAAAVEALTWHGHAWRSLSEAGG